MDDVQKRHLKDIDRAVVWHPFTQMRDYADEEPVIISQGDGVYLVDIDGNRYLDGFSSVWCNVHGHRVSEIDGAIRAQLDRVAHSTLLGLSNIPAVQLAEKLVQIAPQGLSRVFYSDSGATAVEVAVKMAFQYWQQREHPRREKDSFLHLTESYHGDTIGSVSVGGSRIFTVCIGPCFFPRFLHLFRISTGVSTAMGRVIGRALIPWRRLLPNTRIALQLLSWNRSCRGQGAC